MKGRAARKGPIRGLLLLSLLVAGTGAGAETVLVGRTLRGEDDAGRVRWARSYPAALGNLTGPVLSGGTAYLGVGPVVYAVAEDGALRARYDLPGVVTSLDTTGGTVRVSTGGAGYAERFTLGSPEQGGGVQERVVFAPDPAVTGWLARAAREVPEAELARAAASDPLNPFLALREPGV